jgi:hypothetical protein
MIDAQKQQTEGIKCMGVKFEEDLYLAPMQISPLNKGPTTESPKIQSHTFNSLCLLLVCIYHQFLTFFK